MPVEKRTTTAATPSAIYGTVEGKTRSGIGFGEILATLLLLVLALFLYQGYERGREGEFPSFAGDASTLGR